MTSRSTIEDAATGPVPRATSRLTRESLPADLQRALDVVIDKKGRAPVILDVSEIAGYTDFVMIVSGRSDRHVAALADGITQTLRDEGHRPRASDGFGDHAWDALDYDEFIIHIFYHPVRMHYDLESMWSDAPRVELELPAEVMDTSDLDALEVPGTLPEYRGDFMFGGYEDEFEAGEDTEFDENEDYDDEFDGDPFAGEDDLDDDFEPEEPAPPGKPSSDRED